MLDSRYIPSIAFQQFLVDKDTGLPLSGGYIEFYEDNSRLTPKPVFQLTGSPPNYTYSPLSNPLFLSDVGTTADDSENEIPVYFFPYNEDGSVENYYIKIFNSGGVPQYNLQAWPGLTEQDSVNNSNNFVDNQLSNSQFVEVNFVPDEGMVITFDSALSAESFAIAPDWELIVTSTGSGSVTVNQISIEGSLQIKTNPPYTISILPSGATITRLILRQTLNKNPSIWSTTLDQDGYLSGCMLVTSLDGQAHTLEMQYAQSSGPSSPQTIVSGSTLSSGYQFLNATVLLNAGTNTDDSNDGAVYIDIVLPNIGYYALTSVQVLGLDTNVLVDYQQETANRQIDHLFHYYKEPLDFKPIKSYLCGWDFPLNPAQAYGSTKASWVGASSYVWDQTIIWQSVDSSVSVTRATTGKIKGSINIDVASTCQLAVIQYLTVPQILDLLSNPLSSNIVLSSNQANLSGTISLWVTNSDTAPNINTDSKSLVTSLNPTGLPIAFNGTWDQVPRSNYGDAIFTTSNSTNLDNLQSFGFNGWQLDLDDIDLSTITYFAIVVGFSSIEATNNIVIQSCSLVPGSIATIPAPQTYNDVLSDSRYYFEKSYEISTIPGTATQESCVIERMTTYYNGSTQYVYASNFSLRYFYTKVSTPIITFYSSITGDDGQFTFYLGAADHDEHLFTDFYDEISVGLVSSNYSQKNTIPSVDVSGGFSLSGSMYYHYTADSRIGVY